MHGNDDDHMKVPSHPVLDIIDIGLKISQCWCGVCYVLGAQCDLHTNDMKILVPV